MPRYIILMNLTEQGAKNIKEGPTRVQEVAKALEAAGKDPQTTMVVGIDADAQAKDLIKQGKFILLLEVFIGVSVTPAASVLDRMPAGEPDDGLEALK